MGAYHRVKRTLLREHGPTPLQMEAYRESYPEGDEREAEALQNGKLGFQSLPNSCGISRSEPSIL
jgi:hypothetical protein